MLNNGLNRRKKVLWIILRVRMQCVASCKIYALCTDFSYVIFLVIFVLTNKYNKSRKPNVYIG